MTIRSRLGALGVIDLRKFEAVRVGSSLSTCAKGARTSYWPAVCASTSATSVAMFEPDTRDLASFLVENDFSGVVHLRHRGETIFAEASGFATPRWRVPNTLDTRFDTASITKLFTSVATLQLV